ncbi:MAG: phospholipase D-like domain-containing protein [Pseudomonadota bacterium]
MRGLLFGVLLGVAGAAHADFVIPGFELVHTAPLETSLSNADLRSPAAVWSQLFDGAKSEIAIGQFYVAGKAGSAFDAVIERLAAAGARGVKIRFLLDQKGVGISDPDTIARLKTIPNLELHIIDFNDLTGNGILHAKYLLVDRSVAYVGSQNFDWRSFSHIHETGLRVSEPAIVGQIQAIFDQDWRAQALLGQKLQVPALNTKVVAADTAQATFLLASPNRYNPAGVGDAETGLPALLAEAKSEVRIQLLDYAPLSYGPQHTRPYYAVIDNALRSAAARGVKIKLMVSNWNTEAPALAYLKSLSVLPNIEIRVVTLPQASSGFIPFARVIHSKTMVIDGQLAWVGTSNWAGGYMDLSRNMEIVMRNEKMAQRVAALHEQTWSSPYAQALDVNKVYPKPSKGSQ